MNTTSPLLQKKSHQTVKALTVAVFATVIASQLQGCFPIVAGGMAVTALAATDRRTIGTQTEDQAIGLKAENRISNQLDNGAHVAATSYNRKLLLTGEVPSQAAKDQADKIANAVENVTGVINELEIAGASSLTSRSNDALISTKVRATLIDAKDVFASAYKIQTERGVVYLMGRVTEREGARAAELTSGISGVLKVIKVFDYISEDELKRMTTTEARPAEVK